MPLSEQQLTSLVENLITQCESYCENPDRIGNTVNGSLAIATFKAFVGVNGIEYNVNKRSFEEIERHIYGVFTNKCREDKSWKFTNNLPVDLGLQLKKYRAKYYSAVQPVKVPAAGDIKISEPKSNAQLEAELIELRKQLLIATDKLKNYDTRSVAGSVAGDKFDGMSMGSRRPSGKEAEDISVKLIKDIFSKKRAAIYLDLKEEYYKLPLVETTAQNKVILEGLLEKFLLTLQQEQRLLTTDSIINQWKQENTKNKFIVQLVERTVKAHAQKDDKSPVIRPDQIAALKSGLEKKPPVIPNQVLRDQFSKLFPNNKVDARLDNTAAGAAPRGSFADSKAASRRTSPARGTGAGAIDSGVAVGEGTLTVVSAVASNAPPITANGNSAHVFAAPAPRKTVSQAPAVPTGSNSGVILLGAPKPETPILPVPANGTASIAATPNGTGVANGVVPQTPIPTAIPSS